MSIRNGRSETSKINENNSKNPNWPTGAEYVGLPMVDRHTVRVYRTGGVEIGCKVMLLSEWETRGREIAKDNGVPVDGLCWNQYLERLETAARLLGQEPFELASEEPEGWDWEYVNNGCRWVCRGESPMRNEFGWFCGSKHEGGTAPSPFPDLGIPKPYCRSVKGLKVPKP